MTRGTLAVRPATMSVKKMPIDSGIPMRLAGGAHARRHAAVAGRHAVHDGGRVGRREHAEGEAVQEDHAGERQVGEVRRQDHQQQAKLRAASSMPAVAKGRAP